MSDQAPKPKPGSLRDRIAAFERPTASSSPPPAPTPRPKPGNLSWKPKQVSPPSSPRSDVHDDKPRAGASGGMSASDALESIGKAGSLKERMAALQGRGAFGGVASSGSPPAPPKPATEKPKWKPPPVISPPPVEDDEKDTNSHNLLNSPPIPAATPKSVRDVETAATSVPTEEETDKDSGTQPDPEEEERQRRAAIATRMARLGGARFGMGPPVIGKKPVVRKEPKQDTAVPIEEAAVSKAGVVTHEVEPHKDTVPPQETVLTGDQLSSQSPAPSLQAEPSPDYFAEAASKAQRKNSATSTFSVSGDSASTSTTARSPSAMPVPAAPRRTAPPRKRAAKSPAPAPKVLDEEVEVTTSPHHLNAEEHTGKVEPEPEGRAPEGDREEETGEISKDAPEAARKEEIQPTPIPPRVDSSDRPVSPDPVEEVVHGVVTGVLQVANKESGDHSEDAETEGVEIAAVKEKIGLQEERHEESPHQEPTITESEGQDDDNDATRRQRVAERLAKMGGVNPFSPIPRSLPASSPSPPLSPEISERHVAPPSRKNTAEISGRSQPTPPPPLPSSPRPHPEVSPTSSFLQKSASLSTHGDDNYSDRGSIEEGINVKTEDSTQDRPQIDTRETSYPTNNDDEGEIDTTKEVEQEQEQELAYDGASDEQRSDFDAGELSSSAPPPVPQSTRPQAVAAFQESEHEGVRSPLSLPEKRTSLPPPRALPRLPSQQEQQDDEEEYTSPSRVSSPPLPHPARRSMPPPPVPVLDDQQEQNESSDASEYEEQAEADPSELAESRYEEGESDELPTSPLPRRPLPAPPSDDPPVPVPVPRVSASSPRVEDGSSDLTSSVPLPIPTPTSARYNVHISPEAGASHVIDEDRDEPNLEQEDGEDQEQEILDEEEGDPIDPKFHLPRKPSIEASSVALPSPVVSRAPEPVADVKADEQAQARKDANDDEENSEKSRRRTIAERMAKLGGIKFGSAPVPMGMGRPPPRNSHAEDTPEASSTPGLEETTNPEVELTEEEEETARKQRIAAKLAGMGGMRIGMMPLGMGNAPQTQARAIKKEDMEEGVSAPSPPPHRVPPPIARPLPTAPSHQIDTDSEFESLDTSEDGIKIEAEDSELEEVHYEEAVEEEAPPVPIRPAGRTSGSVPLPSREAEASRKMSGLPPPTPGNRPPVPNVPLNITRRTSVQEPRKSSVDSSYNAPHSPRSRGSIDTVGAGPRSSISQVQSDYVMVEEPESEEVPPPPPPRSSRAPLPQRSSTQQQQQQSHPPLETHDTTSSQWELPSIPTSSLEFGTSEDMSLSMWSETPTYPPPPSAGFYPSKSDMITTKRSSQAPPLRVRQESMPIMDDLQLNADDLMAVWGRVGVQICEVATTLFEKSKRSVIGDGSYAGFVKAVLSLVPNARLPVGDLLSPYGYLVYAQSGGAVQRRASEIMPGDIAVFYDAKLKGHKGLQPYNQSIGSGEPLVGVVSEFEPKKAKIRVFHASQHVGQQTVETASYRLEDLKSGGVKVFRVLEA